MDEYKTQIELFKSLKPALNIKLRLLKEKKYYYIKVEDIWNYLKTSKWMNAINLSISEMVNDIINVNEKDIDNYLKDKLKNEKKVLNLD